ncbi:MAG: hypothetical protein ABW043_01995 [Devosia sp.]|uniref:hypothetical protein n=1 Tax=Devosia sp. TaxID=1871048 RepID=UPI0033983DE5
MVDQTNARATAVAEDLLEPSEGRAQICYRLSRERRNLLHRLALDRRTTVQALLDEAVGDFLTQIQADI